MILFLDFDGVLHPAYDGQATPADRLFCHLRRFEAIMRDFPTVEIVISSAWRYQFPIENLLSRFSPDIAARITGATLLHLNAAGEPLAIWREQEILNWLISQDRADEPWIALDDTVWHFQQHRDCLVACTWYEGLDDAVEMKLRAALAEVILDA
jgi:hypothetical protein